VAAVVESFGKDKAKTAAPPRRWRDGGDLSEARADEVHQGHRLGGHQGQVSDPERATSAGLRSAEQVAMAVDSLFRAVNAVAKPPEGKAIDAAIGKMFDELPTKPADFDPKKFTANLQNVAKNIK
jgi:hypothetical protein